MQSDHGDKRPSKVIMAVLAAVFVAALAGLFWSYSLAGRLTHAEAQLATTQQKNRQLATALNETNAKLTVTSQTLGHRLNVTQRELRRRAEAMRHMQQTSAAPPQLAQGQAQPGASTRATPAANSGVAAGTSSAGVVKTNAVEATPPVSNAAQILHQMQKAKGDLGILSGLIATNPSELKVLERMGVRNYYPFTLRKGKKEGVATIALRLRRVNEKHNTYTMTVYTGAKKIEKKNRALDEPVQFYAGKQHQLFELIVNQIGHDQVQGYLTTPKSAPAVAPKPAPKPTTPQKN